MLVEIEHLTKRFGDKVAVDDLSLSIEAGEVVGFLGHNGAGKTTTLKQMVTLLTIDEGRIVVDGHDVAKEPLAAKRAMAYIPDNPDMYDFMTALQYLRFIGDAYGVDPEVQKERIQQLAQRFEIADNLGSTIASLSHGMKQKIALISAFMHRPKLILLDEPFVGLDPKASRTLKELMRESCDAGSSIFFSTHVLEVAEKLCDRLAIIRKGKLIKFGDTHEVIGAESLEEVFFELESETGDAHVVAVD